MKAEAPPDGLGDCGKTLAMTQKAVGIILADALDAGDDNTFALLDPFKADASVEGEVFFGRVADLQHMALEPGGGKTGDGRIDGVERHQEVADQDQLASSW